MTAFPAFVLADVYEKYGTRLLELNVMRGRSGSLGHTLAFGRFTSTREIPVVSKFVGFITVVRRLLIPLIGIFAGSPFYCLIPFRLAANQNSDRQCEEQKAFHATKMHRASWYDSVSLAT